MADVNMYINIHVVHNTRMYRDVVYVPIFRFSYVSGGGKTLLRGNAIVIIVIFPIQPECWAYHHYNNNNNNNNIFIQLDGLSQLDSNNICINIYVCVGYKPPVRKIPDDLRGRPDTSYAPRYVSRLCSV